MYRAVGRRGIAIAILAALGLFAVVTFALASIAPDNSGLLEFHPVQTCAFGTYAIDGGCAAPKSPTVRKLFDLVQPRAADGAMVVAATSCSAGLTNCGGNCVNRLTDGSNCGACGAACPSGNVCSSGSCQRSCQIGATNCSGSCVEVNQNDVNNCGSCGHACSAGQICSSGSCIATPASPTLLVLGNFNLATGTVTAISASGASTTGWNPQVLTVTLKATSGTVNYSITGLPTWLTVNNPTGTVGTSGSNVQFSLVTADANTQTASQTATVTFTNSDTGSGTQSRTMRLNVVPAMLVSGGAFTTTAPAGGTFSSTTVSYTLSTTTGSTSYYVAGVPATPSWLTLTSGASSGTVTTSGTTLTFSVDGSQSNVTGPVHLADTLQFLNTGFPSPVPGGGTQRFNFNANLNVLALTTTALGTSINPSAFGQSVTYTATVTSNGAGAPTGTVTFLDGGSIGTGSLSGNPATATFSTSGLAVGGHTISASYGGDSNFNTSTTTSNVSQTVNTAPTATVVSSPGPTVFGQAVTFTATISITTGACTPTGTVTFSDGVSPLGSPATVSGNVATLTTSGLSVGSHTIGASYSGDGNCAASSTSGITQTVSQGATTTTVSAAPNPNLGGVGQSVTLTANVSVTTPANGTPTGTVTFKDGTTALGSPVAVMSGTATLSTTAIGQGVRSISATYAGDTNFTTSNGSTQAVNKGNTTMSTVSAAPNPSVWGQSLTLSSTISVTSPATGTPTGQVTFKDGSTTLGTGTLTGGSATFTTSALAVGAHNITATYQGDDSFYASAASTAGTVTVGKGSTTTSAVTALPTPSVWGQSVTLSSTISVTSPANGTPIGPVTFKDGATTLGTGTIAAGKATLTTTTLAVGTHHITATYQGDDNFNTSPTSAPTSVTVNKGGTSTSTVTALPAPSVWGQSVTLSSTISVTSPASGTPTGQVTFKDGATTLGTGTIAGSTATLATSTLAVGAHHITATYQGDGNFNASAASAAGTVTVNKGSATTSTITALPAPSVWGQSVTLSSTISVTSPASGTPTGQVTFKDGATTLGTGTIAGGAATLPTSTLAVGAHNITATYQGDGNFNASAASTTGTVTINKGDTTVSTASAVPAPSVSGESVTLSSTISVTSPANGTPTGQVNFKDRATTLGTGTIAGGNASFTTTALVAGSHHITTTYQGDDNFNVSPASAPATVTVKKGHTTASAVSGTPNPSVTGQSITLSSTISATSPASGTPTGQVTFKEGATTLGAGTIVSGKATLATSALAVGAHNITATYEGDDSFAVSPASPAGAVTVNKGGTTTSTVTAQPAQSVSGQSVTLSSTVSVTSPASGTPTGQVTFTDGTTVLGTGTIAGGNASLPTSTLAAGAHTVTATYNGDDDFNASPASAAKTVTVKKGGTTTILTAAPNPTHPGHALQLTATVAVTPPASGQADGSVSFKDGTKSLGTAAVTGGKASLTTSSLAIGTHTIASNYGGSSSFKGSANTLPVTIDARSGPESQVNTVTTGAQELPAVAALKSGYVVAWASNAEDNSGYGVYMQRYASGGAKVGSETLVNKTKAGNQTQPAVAGLKNGDFVVVWQSADQSGLGVYGQIFSASGVKSGKEFRVNTATTDDQSLPSVAPLTAGGFVVAWTSKGEDKSGLGVYAQLYDTAGEATGNEFRVNTTKKGAQSAPSTAGLTGGGFVIAWQGPDPSGLGVYAQVYDATGAAVGVETHVNSTTVNDQSLPSLAPLDNGGFVAAWQSNLQDGSGLGVYIQRFTASGAKSGGETRVNTTTVSDQGAPSGSGFSDGGFVVVWTSNNQDGSGQGVYGQAFNDAGAKVNVEFPVNTTTAGNQTQPAVAAFTSGNFVAVWTSAKQDGSSTGIYLQRFLIPGAH